VYIYTCIHIYTHRHTYTYQHICAYDVQLSPNLRKTEMVREKERETAAAAAGVCIRVHMYVCICLYFCFCVCAVNTHVYIMYVCNIYIYVYIMYCSQSRGMYRYVWVYVQICNACMHTYVYIMYLFTEQEWQAGGGVCTDMDGCMHRYVRVCMDMHRRGEHPQQQQQCSVRVLCMFICTIICFLAFPCSCVCKRMYAHTKYLVAFS
jgi:hypothetical protein